jgi:uncharacterized membrane protein YoaK (UPF0700 family)
VSDHQYNALEMWVSMWGLLIMSGATEDETMSAVMLCCAVVAFFVTMACKYLHKRGD